MTQFFYLIALIVSISGMLLIDYRYRLAFWKNGRRAAWTVGVSMVCFILLDLLHIGSDVFWAGPSKYYLSIRLAPEFPIEELFFLFLLSHTTLVVYRFGEVRWPRTRS